MKFDVEQALSGSGSRGGVFGFDVEEALKMKKRRAVDVADDLAKGFGGAVVSAVGAVPTAVGRAVQEGGEMLFGLSMDQAKRLAEADGKPEMALEWYEKSNRLNPFSAAGRAIESGGRWISEQGDSLRDARSDDAKELARQSTPDGDLTQPSTWTMGENPTVEGVAQVAADVMGSMAPPVATAIATRGRSTTTQMRAGGATVAGQIGGSAMDEAGEYLSQFSDEQLRQVSPVFRDMEAKGYSAADARTILEREAENRAAAYAAPVGYAGGKATAALLGKPGEKLAGKFAGTIPKAIVLGTLGATEEGLQEISEGIATRAGINDAAGTDRSLTEGTFGEFVLGAKGGGATGAGKGVIEGIAARRQAGRNPQPQVEGEPRSITDQTPAGPSVESIIFEPSQPAVTDRRAGRQSRPEVRLAELEILKLSRPLNEVELQEGIALLQQIQDRPESESVTPSFTADPISQPMETTQSAAEISAGPVLSDVGKARQLDGIDIEENRRAFQVGGTDAELDNQEGATAFGGSILSPSNSLTPQASTNFWSYIRERGYTPGQVAKGTELWATLKADFDQAKVNAQRASRSTSILPPQQSIPIGSAPAAQPLNHVAPTAPGIDLDLQNRDRSRAASVAQMTDIARNPDFMRLASSRTPDAGAPMVFAVGDDAAKIPENSLGRRDVAVMADGQRVPFRYAVLDARTVEPSNFADGRLNDAYIGNMPGTLKALNSGRTAGLRAAYELGTAGKYQAELIADAAAHGVPVDAIERTPNPILVRVYSEKSNTPDMAAKSQGQGLGMSPTELAFQDAPLIDSSVLAVHQPGDVTSAANRDFVRAFVGKLNQSGQDVAGMMTADGQLSQDGRKRIQAALMQVAYGDADLVSELFDSLDTDIKAIGEALKAVAGEWANMRDSARQGLINPDADTTDNLVQAVNMIRKTRRERSSLYDLVRQPDLMTGEIPDPVTVALLRLFYSGQYLTRAVGRDGLIESLRDYVNTSMGTTAGADMFGQTVTPSDILNGITEQGNSNAQDQPQEGGRGTDGRSDPGGSADTSWQADQRWSRTEGGRGTGENRFGERENPAGSVGTIDAQTEEGNEANRLSERLTSLRLEALPIVRTDAYTKKGITLQQDGERYLVVFKGEPIATLSGKRTRDNVVKAIVDALATPRDTLTAYTSREVIEHQESSEAVQREAEAADRKAAAEENERRVRAEVARRSEAAAGTFELGQDPMANLTGQQDVFSAREEAKTTGKIEDLGEKIGGARKDVAVSTGRTGRTKAKDDRPAWARRFDVAQIVAGDNEGRWTIHDNRAKDWMGKPKQVGGRSNTFATEQEALDAIPLAAVSMKHRAVPTGTKSVDGEYNFEIWRDINDRKRVKVVDKVFPSRVAALEYMAKNAQAIMETNTTFGEADLPRPDNTNRTGVKRRTCDVEGRDFMESFGFRGVEFGNWNNQAERQEVMNAAYDGLMDLAEVVQIPPRAIGLNGDLALAFGARGQGLSSAVAHYERSRAVINLTKMNGAGALAHEWFHALDHYFGRQDGKTSSQWKINSDGTKTFEARGAEDDMASGGFRRVNSGVRQELRDAYKNVMETMFNKAEQYVEDTAKADQFVAKSREDVAKRLDMLRKDLSEQKDVRYYKRNNKPASAEQLAEFDTIAKQIMGGESLEISLMEIKGSKSASGNRWSTEALERLSAIYKAVRGRSGFGTGDSRGVMDDLRNDMTRYSQRLKMLAEAQAGDTKTKRVLTEFAMDAKELDQGRGENYWTTPHEMAARAFQGYVEDKIAEQGAQSPFLNYAPENAGILTPWGAKRPYPYGQERKAINEAFDAFVGTLETRETEQGIAMFSRAQDFAAEVDQAIEAGRDNDAQALRQQVSIGATTPAVLRMLGVAEKPVYTSRNMLAKMHLEHGVPKDQLKNLAGLLENPAMVFESDTQPGRLVVVTDVVVSGQPLVIAVEPNGKSGRLDVVYLPSMYPRSDAGSKFQQWIKAGKLKYADKSRSRQLATTAGLQLPGVVQRAVGFTPVKYKTEADILQSGLSRGPGGGMDFKELQTLVNGIKAKMPNMPKVHVMRDPSQAPKRLRDYITLQGAWGDVEGAMHNGELYMFASGLSDPLRAEHVLAEHEAAHFGLRAILGPKLKTAMNLIYANNPAVRQAATRLQKRGKLTNDEAVEEVIVDMPTSELVKLKGWRQVVRMMADWLGSNGFQNMAKKLNDWLDGSISDQERADLFVAELVRGARDYVAGKRPGYARNLVGTRLSFTLAEDIARQEKWFNTEAKARGFKDMEDLFERDYAVFEKLAAKWREKNPTKDGSLLSRASDTKSEAFKKWFGDSKVVDAKGKPLVVYHGSKQKFDEFDMNKGQDGAMFFTTTKEHAEFFGDVSDVYLSMQDPMVIDQSDLDDRVTDDDIENGVLPRDYVAEFVKEAKAAGKDGLVITDFGDLQFTTDVYLPFKATQIKSATGNDGTFDPANPDIRFSRSETIPDKIEVGGNLRPTTNSNGQPIHPTKEGVRNFWRWVASEGAWSDEQGRPIPLYHGTNQDIEAFDPNRTGGLINLSTKPSTGTTYANAGSGGGRTASDDRIFVDPLTGENFTPGKIEGLSVINFVGSKGTTLTTKEVQDRYEFGEFDVVSGGANVLQVYAKGKILDLQTPEGIAVLASLPLPTEATRRGEAAREVIKQAKKGDFNWATTQYESSIRHWENILNPMLKERGYYGIKFSDDNYNDPYTLAVFGRRQVKSAIGNDGAFDPTSADIRFSRSTLGNQPQSPQAPQGPWQKAKAKALELTSPEAIANLLYDFQDKYIDLKRLRDHIKAIGGTINDLNDAYLREELYHKRLSKRTEDFLDQELRPLLADMRNRSLSLPELERYLHARHAPEANMVLAERNPTQAMIDARKAKANRAVRDLEMQLQRARTNNSATKAIENALEEARDEAVIWSGAQAFRGTEAHRLSLSGMSDADAKAVIDGLTPRQREHMEALAAKVDAMQAKTLDTLENYGLIDKATVNGWRSSYRYYVPLHRDEARAESDRHPIGMGFSVKGTGMKSRVGSNEKVTNILTHIVLQREAALTRGEKNNVTKSLYLMAAQNPDESFWEVDRPPMVKTIDQRNGFVRKGVDPTYKNKPNVVMVRIGGKDQAIVFNERNPNAVRLAESMKNMDVGDLHVLLNLAANGVKWFPFGTRWFAQINTQWNPIFGVINFARDVQAAALNLSTTELAGKEAEVASPKQLATAMRAIYRERRGKSPKSQEWTRLWNEMQEIGGTTGYRDLFADTQDRADALVNEIKALDRGQAMKAAHAVVDWLSDYNEVMENAVRLSAYKVALDQGMTKERAASLAKNLTVNFNRRGRLGRELGAAYAFFNAALQGTARMVETLRGPMGKKIMYGGVMLGAVNTLIGMAMMGGDDEDEANKWAQIHEFIRERSIIVPLGREDYFAIPMPLGFHVFPNIGRMAVEFALGGSEKNAGTMLGKLMMILADAFNPLGSATDLSWESAVGMAAPTVVDPIWALAINKDWTGRSIYREQQSGLDQIPGHQMAKDSASTFSSYMSEAINRITGGTEYRPGAWSPNPDQLDYVIGQLTGGLGRELMKVDQSVRSIFTGDELPPHKIPLVGRLYGNNRGPAGQSGQFYENVKELNELENELKGRLRNNGDVQALRDTEPLLTLIPMANQYENHIRKLRDQRRQVVERKGDGYQDRVRELDQQIGDTMANLNKAVAKARKEAVQ